MSKDIIYFAENYIVYSHNIPTSGVNDVAISIVDLKSLGNIKTHPLLFLFHFMAINESSYTFLQ